ncbi:MAG: hypothetical protein M0Q53_18230 [Prolixibacteraceae bacterium]|jgi:hypothetical protein|nr:hypothetical protein [Prolixibacteraceae bacterium]
MKHVFLFLLLAFAVVGCKKEKTCKCTVSLDGKEFSTSTVTTKESCSSGNSETNVIGIITKTTCVEQ